MDLTNNVDCELDPSVHKQVIEKAVSKALEVVADKRYESHKIEEQLL